MRVLMLLLGTSCASAAIAQALSGSGVASTDYPTGPICDIVSGTEETPFIVAASDGAVCHYRPGMVDWMSQTDRYHTSAVRGLALSPDGRLLASCGLDGKVHVTIPRDWIHRRPVLSIDTYANAIAYSPDGKTLATGGLDGVVRLWDAACGAPRGIVGEHLGPVHSVAYSPDGHVLASSGDDRVIRLWSAGGGLLRPLVGHGATVHRVRFSPDGVTLASASDDGSVIIWNVADGSILRRLTGHVGAVNDVAFSLDGQKLVSGGADGHIRIWRTEDGICLRNEDGESGPITAVTFRPWPDFVTAGTASGGLVHFDPTRKWVSRYWLGSPIGMYSLNFSSDGRSLVVCGAGEVRIWSLECGTPSPPIRRENWPGFMYASLLPGDRELLLVKGDGTVLRWDVAEAKVLSTHSLGGRVRFATASKRGTVMAVCGRENPESLVTLHADGRSARFQDVQGYVLWGAISPDGALAIAPIAYGLVQLWRTSDGALINLWKADEQAVQAIAFSPDGGQVAIGGMAAGAVSLWGVPDAAPFGSMPTTHAFDTVTYSPSGRWLATGGFRGEVHVRRSGDATLVAVLEARGARVQHLAFSPDECLLAVGTADGVVDIWRTEDWHLVRSLSPAAWQPARAGIEY